jgi:hypothetical protein
MYDDKGKDSILYICVECLTYKDPYGVDDDDFIEELVTKYTSFSSVEEAYDKIRNEKKTKMMSTEE